MGERLGEVEHCGHSGVTSFRLLLQPPARTTSARGRCSRFLMERLFLERARENGISIYQGALNSMDWGSSIDGEKHEENDKRTAVNAVFCNPRVVPVPSDASYWTPALAHGPGQREYISRLPRGVASPSLAVRYYDPGPAGLGLLCPVVGAVEGRTVQWEVPSLLGFRVESRLLLHDSLPENMSHLVPIFGGTRPTPFVVGSDGAERC